MPSPGREKVSPRTRERRIPHAQRSGFGETGGDLSSSCKALGFCSPEFSLPGLSAFPESRSGRANEHPPLHQDLTLLLPLQGWEGHAEHLSGSGGRGPANEVPSRRCQTEVRFAPRMS